MKFMLTCEEMDGLVFTDKNSLTELDSNLLYSMDIFLDPSGKSELVFDFPDETWDAVRMRETQPVKEFCNSGKMIIWSFQNTEKECELVSSNKIPASPKWLYLPSGSLLAVSASELIQCLSYPELEMETFFKLETEAGWYAFWNEGTDKIIFCKKEPQNTIIQNI